MSLLSGTFSPTTAPPATLPSATPDTQGLWDFNGDLNSRVNTLPLVHASTRYVPGFIPGTRAAVLDGVSFDRTVFDAVLAIAGPLTVSVILSVHNTGVTRIVCSYSNTGEAEGDNHLYTPQYNANDHLNYFAEEGAGINITWTDTTRAGPLYTPYHFALTRDSSGDVVLYYNGQEVGASSGLAVPTGSANGAFGCFGGMEGYAQCLHVQNAERSAAEVLAEARQVGLVP